MYVEFHKQPFMLSVMYAEFHKKPFILSVIMQNIIMLNVIMLIVKVPSYLASNTYLLELF
jgi:hypothetical protein